MALQPLPCLLRISVSNSPSAVQPSIFALKVASQLSGDEISWRALCLTDSLKQAAIPCGAYEGAYLMEQHSGLTNMN